MKRHTKFKRILTNKNNSPRLSVFKSSKHIYAQVIDDTAGVTLAAASSLKSENGNNVEGAREVGKRVAEAAAQKKIVNVVFDRGSFAYKGRVKALADAARENGLKF